MDLCSKTYIYVKQNRWFTKLSSTNLFVNFKLDPGPIVINENVQHQPHQSPPRFPESVHSLCSLVFSIVFYMLSYSSLTNPPTHQPTISPSWLSTYPPSTHTPTHPLTHPPTHPPTHWLVLLRNGARRLWGFLRRMARHGALETLKEGFSSSVATKDKIKYVIYLLAF